MKKFVAFLISLIAIVVGAVIVLTPISAEKSLKYQLDLVQSEKLAMVTQQFDIDIYESVKQLFQEKQIELTDEEVKILVDTMLTFEYSINEDSDDTPSTVSLKVLTVDMVGLIKAKVKENVGNIIVGVLQGKDVQNEVIAKEVIASLKATPKTYSTEVIVNMRNVKDIFYLIDFANNNDLYNALSGGLFYELDMLESY